ncbi:hypothetical protein Esti_002065 [Eimeria stiedai]
MQHGNVAQQAPPEQQEVAQAAGGSSGRTEHDSMEDAVASAVFDESSPAHIQAEVEQAQRSPSRIWPVVNVLVTVAVALLLATIASKKLKLAEKSPVEDERELMGGTVVMLVEEKEESSLQYFADDATEKLESIVEWVRQMPASVDRPLSREGFEGLRHVVDIRQGGVWYRLVSFFEEFGTSFDPEQTAAVLEMSLPKFFDDCKAEAELLRIHRVRLLGRLFGDSSGGRVRLQATITLDQSSKTGRGAKYMKE